MSVKDGYLVFDVGTGNARVAVVGTTGEVHSIERADIQYESEPIFPDSKYFAPEQLWQQLLSLAKRALTTAKEINIKAITSTSQRQGIVLIDKDGRSFIGLPNIDNRGREWENETLNPDLIYKITGRLPTALFSALKLVGLRERQPFLWEKIDSFTSISDWVTYKLSGVITYEPSQATETLLYDVKEHQWSSEMCEKFGIPSRVLPEIREAGESLGHITSDLAKELGLKQDVVVIVGGGDTQLAIASTEAKNHDVVIVSDTTTPICKINDDFHIDSNKNVWTNAHTDQKQWLLETNPGVTGLNYQKLKSIFYPNESYEVMEEEMATLESMECVSTLGQYMTSEKNATKKGGFVFDAPISHSLQRAHFVAAALWEIACSIKWNYDQLIQVTPNDQPYVWACGGGFQSKTLSQYIANLLNKEVYIRDGYNQASVVGASVICNQTLGVKHALKRSVRVIQPDAKQDMAMYDEWAKAQQFFSHMNHASKNR